MKDDMRIISKNGVDYYLQTVPQRCDNCGEIVISSVVVYDCKACNMFSTVHVITNHRAALDLKKQLDQLRCDLRLKDILEAQ